jgi:aminopeptidase N
MDREVFCQGESLGFGGGDERNYPPDLGLEPIHLDLNIHVDLENEVVTGSVTLSIRSRRPGASSLILNAVSLAIIHAQDPENHPITWTYNGELLQIAWSEPFEDSEQRKLVVEYRADQPIAGLYFSKPTANEAEGYWYVVTDHETERARYWLPCIDSPSVRPRLDFHITADIRFTALANGQLVGEQQHKNGTKTTHWRLDKGCPSYLLCFAVGNFLEAKQPSVNDVPISFFSTPRFTAADLERSFGLTGRMLEWMQEKLGMPYPYHKYFQLALPAVDGAMENISLVTWTEQAVLNEELAKERGRVVDSVNVHEMAHSYFGDLVVCRDFAHAWLKESWATYMEQCWLEDAHGDDEALYDFYLNARDYQKEADEEYHRPIVTRTFRSSRQMYDRHLYPGGACRLHMLRKQLGDEVFWPAVRRYLVEFADRVVETENFRGVLEAESGSSLVEFFDQWFYRPGYPHIKICFTYDLKSKEGKFEIQQSQVKTADAIQKFRFTTDLAWYIEGQRYSKTVEITEAEHTITVSMDREPQMVRFDPDHRLLYKLEFDPGNRYLLHQLEEAEDIIGRIQAGQMLLRTGSPQHVDAVVQAFKRERFWGVRLELAKSLGENNSEFALRGLIDIVYSERDPRVLEAIVTACGRYQDVRIRDTLVDTLNHGLPYRARGCAYRSLGTQRKLAPWDLLERACTEADFSGFIQGSAFIGLAETRRTEAVPILIEILADSSIKTQARIFLVEALGNIGSVSLKESREKVIEALEGCLRESDRKIRRAAGNALIHMNARESLPRLEIYRTGLPLEDQIKLDRGIAKLKEEESPQVTALRKDLEELQVRYRTVEKRLERLESRTPRSES